MTESTGGSDVGASLTRAERDEQGHWRLYGTKWFTSAITSQMALTLARPEGNGPGGSGLALFYVETHDDAGRLNGIRVDRLKDKLGTRKVPTAELMLDGARAELVGRHAQRHSQHRADAQRHARVEQRHLGRLHAPRRSRSRAPMPAQRRAFGAPLDEQPLHVDTLAGLEAETRGAFLLAFELVELLGRQEAGELERRAARAAAPAHADREAADRQAGGCRRQRVHRGVRRRRLRRGHGPAGAAARYAGAADLGRHDQRALARCAAARRADARRCRRSRRESQQCVQGATG